MTQMYKDKREKNINNLIDNNIPKQFVKKAKNSSIHWEFIQCGKNNKLDSYFNKIKNDIDNQIAKKLRKTKIDYRIKKYIDIKNQQSARESTIYNKFIDNGDTSKVDEVLENIKIYLDRITKIDLELKKLSITPMSYKNHISYKNYIDGLISIENTIAKINIEYEKEQRKYKIIQFIKKNFKKNIQLTYTDKNYQKYINEEHINLEQFNNIIKEKIKLDNVFNQIINSHGELSKQQRKKLMNKNIKKHKNNFIEGNMDVDIIKKIVDKRLQEIK
jgi:hypothetical protein